MLKFFAPSDSFSASFVDRFVGRVIFDLITQVSDSVGADLRRDVLHHVQQDGFRLRWERNLYFEIVNIIEAAKPEPRGIAPIRVVECNRKL